LQTTTTPAVLLVLARVAADAGDVPLADKFTGMAVAFHRTGRCVIQEKRHATAIWGARAFLLEPGHEAFARQLLDDAGVNKTRVWYLLGACHAYYSKDFEAARKMCGYAQSADSASSNERDTLLWEGERLSLHAYAQKLEEALDAVSPKKQPEPTVEVIPGW
jgi:hypothetical protein